MSVYDKLARRLWRVIQTDAEASSVWSDFGYLYSVWNVDKAQWATQTNYSTPEEAQRLLTIITRQCRGDYMIKSRKFGTIKE